MLSQKEIELRDELIKDGIKDCRELIGNQKLKEMYFFYEGSMDGFEECKNLNTLESYVKRIHELSEEEYRELLRSLKGDTEEKRLLKEQYQLYDNKETDSDEVWKLKGIITQIDFVYERLKAYKIIFVI